MIDYGQVSAAFAPPIYIKRDGIKILNKKKLKVQTLTDVVYNEI